jgi:hypothetical protein
MEVFLKNSDGDYICFRHAVRAVMEKDESISMHGFDDRDCGQSGAWWLYGNCVECNKEQEDVG